MKWEDFLNKRDSIGLSLKEADEFLLLKMYRDGQENMRKKAILARNPASIALIPLRESFDEN